MEVFHVDVSDDKMNRIIFQMQKENEGWKIISTSLPVWVCEVEPKLNEILQNEVFQPANTLADETFNA